jgi:hypothetical protein
MTHVTCSVLKTIKKKETKTEKSRSHIAPSYTSNKKIQTIFNSYTGRTFIFYDNFIITYSERQKYGINSLKIKENFFQKNLWTGQFYYICTCFSTKENSKQSFVFEL